MSSHPSAFETDARRLARRTLRDLGLGFVYWLGFVLILEPGNLMRWTPLDGAGWAREAVRLVGAGLLGAAATPAILAVTRRLPIEGPFAGRRLAAHLGLGAAMTLVLIVASCLLAALLPNAVHHRLSQEIADELAANGPLVAAWIAGLTALAHALRAKRGEAGETGTGVGLTIRQRGRFARVDIAQVQWIETQGNYLALHGSSGTRLVRQTAKTFEADLDPRRFVRIHRRTIVALDAVESLTPLAAGDAALRLKTGESLRVSRSCRPRLWAALQGFDAR